MKKEKNIPNFKIPEGYFDTFEKRLFSKIEEDNLPKTAGFKVPINYFENVDPQIFKTIRGSEKPKKVISLFPKKYYGYAAAIAACLLIGFTIFNYESNQSGLDALQLAAIDTYIEDGNLNYDLYDLTTYIDDKDIKEINLETQQFSENALEDYLLENLDAATIINEK